jgi:hypothetical protein
MGRRSYRDPSRGSDSSLCPAPVLRQSVSYVQNHKLIDLYIRNIIPIGI